MTKVDELPECEAALAVRSEDGTELRVEVFGRQDAPTLVLVHGWTCAIRFWTSQIRDLSRDFRVVAFDLRGHGRSQPARDGNYCPDAFADDLQAVLAAVLRDGERALVAGHSLGAMSIAAWANHYPAQVPKRAAAIAMINTGLGDLVREASIIKLVDRLQRVREPIGQRVLSMATPLRRTPHAALLRAVRYVALSPNATDEQVEFCEELLRECSHRVRAACGSALAHLDLHHSVEKLTVPTMVIASQLDKLTPPAHARRLASSLPQLVRLEEIPYVGHMSPVEAPGEVNSCLRELSRRYLLAQQPSRTASRRRSPAEAHPSGGTHTGWQRKVATA